MQQLVADSAVTAYDITESSVRQSLVHDRALGRVSSTFRVAAILAQLIATIAAGFLAEAIGLRATAWLAPFGGLVAAAILWGSPVRRLIVLPGAPRIASRPAEPGAGPLADAAVAALETERNQPIGG